MNHVHAELDQLSSEAWAELSGDVRRAGRSGARCLEAFVREHPMLAVGAGTALGLAATSTLMKGAGKTGRTGRRGWFRRGAGLLVGVARQFATDGLMAQPRAESRLDGSDTF